MSADPLPTDGEHRGVPLHAGQNEARLAIVCRDIDRAHGLIGLAELVEFADDPANAPESRLLAAAKATASLDEASDRRDPRTRATRLSRERIRASVAGVNSVTWQSRQYYASALDALLHRAARREP